MIKEILETMFHLRINGMSDDEFIDFIDKNCSENSKIKIKEKRRIIKSGKTFYSCSEMRFMNEYHYGDIYYIEFSYDVIKKGLFGEYEMVHRVISDKIYFIYEKDAEIYMEYADGPSRKIIADYYSGYQMREMIFKNNKNQIFCADLAKSFGCYYFFNYIHQTETYISLETMMKKYDMIKIDEIKEDKKDNGDTDMQWLRNDPKIQYLLLEEIERTEKSLERLKRLL